MYVFLFAEPDVDPGLLPGTHLADVNSDRLRAVGGTIGGVSGHLAR